VVLRRPRNWNPVSVTLRAIDDDATKWDPVFKVPLNRKARAPEYTYQAQVNFKMKEQDEKNRMDTGDRTTTRGHLVMRTYDLAPNSSLPKPEKGWQVTGLYVGTDQEMVVDYLVEQVRHESPLRGRPLLIYIEFIENVENARSP